MNEQQAGSVKKRAYHLILLMGMVSLFGDITYEGARSVSGPFLLSLSASATVVGFTSGAGEFLGYALRLLSGYLSDKTKKYWLFTGLGYGMLLSIPLLAFAGYWQIAALLFLLERIGKALRAPARDTILSYATKTVGRGWGFAIHEALDQIGAVLGPLVFCATFFLKYTYREGFSFFWLPALCSLGTLFAARMKFPAPAKMEAPVEKKGENGLPRAFSLYALFTFLSVTGFTNFPLLSFHFKKCEIMTEGQIPLFYAVAMGVDAIVALLVGKIYDKVGIKAVLTIPALTLPVPFLAFSRSYGASIAASILWGAVMGNHEAVMRA
ncbi:MAG: MFS transporter, partial [Planctomycetota bacterium]|nr:MFS transporter [Planctomycetota bacterium]